MQPTDRFNFRNGLDFWTRIPEGGLQRIQVAKVSIRPELKLEKGGGEVGGYSGVSRT